MVAAWGRGRHPRPHNVNRQMLTLSNVFFVALSTRAVKGRSGGISGEAAAPGRRTQRRTFPADDHGARWGATVAGGCRWGGCSGPGSWLRKSGRDESCRPGKAFSAGACPGVVKWPRLRTCCCHRALVKESTNEETVIFCARNAAFGRPGGKAVAISKKKGYAFRVVIRILS